MAHVLAKELREAVLQAAMQGKLTEQLPTDTPVEETLKQIVKEKEKLIKEKKIKKEKPLPEIDEDEVPFDIPENWIWVHIPTFSNSYLGKTLNKSTDSGEIKPYLCSINVYWSGLNTDEIKTAKFTQSEQEKYKLQRGDLLVCEGGEVGRSIVWDLDKEMYYQNALHRIRCYDHISPYYVKNVLLLYKLTGVIDGVSKGIGIKHLVQNSLFSLPIPLPPIEEQARIVAKVDELMAKIDEYEKLENQLVHLKEQFPKDMKDSLLQAGMMGKLTEQLPTDTWVDCTIKDIKQRYSFLDTKETIDCEAFPKELPSTWDSMKLYDLYDFVDYRGKTPKKAVQGIPLVTASNVRKGFIDYSRKEYITEDEYTSRTSRGITEKNDILFTTEAPMGMVSLCPFEKCSCGQRVITFKRKSVNLDNRFYLMYMLSPIFQSLLLSNATGTTAQGIKGKKLMCIPAPLPPIEEQARIVAKLDQLLPLVESLEVN